MKRDRNLSGVTGDPIGYTDGLPYLDGPAVLHDQFPARVTHVLSPPHADGTTAAKLGFWEQGQNPESGVFEDKPDGRHSDGTANWAVGVTGAGYKANDRLNLQRHRRRADLFEVVTAGGGGTGLVLVLVTAAVPDPGWSQAQVQRFSADGSARLPASPTEVADVRPLSGGRLKANGYYACLDSGGKNAAVTPARRRLWAVTPPMKEVTIQTQVCSAQTGQTTLQTVSFWVLDV